VYCSSAPFSLWKKHRGERTGQIYIPKLRIPTYDSLNTNPTAQNEPLNSHLKQPQYVEEEEKSPLMTRSSFSFLCPLSRSYFIPFFHLHIHPTLPKHHPSILQSPSPPPNQPNQTHTKKTLTPKTPTSHPHYLTFSLITLPTHQPPNQPTNHPTNQPTHPPNPPNTHSHSFLVANKEP